MPNRDTVLDLHTFPIASAFCKAYPAYKLHEVDTLPYSLVWAHFYHAAREYEQELNLQPADHGTK